MIKLIYTFSIFLCSIFLSAQSNYWQQHLEYSIDAELDTNLKVIKAQCEILYLNNSPDTLDRIYIHLWANAFSNKTSPFADQALKLGMTDYYFAEENKLGGYQEIKVQLPFEDQQIPLQYIDDQKEIAYIPLKGGLLPSQEISIVFYYELKIPHYFARLGQSSNMYNMVAWYPKPAVYDQKGWHTFPYLSMGEFYSEFANYNVRLKMPQDFTVAHSGNETSRNIKDGTLTIVTRLENAHDYAWFTSRALTVEKEKVILKNKQEVELNIYRKAGDTIWKDAMHYSKQVLTYMADYMGDYPYTTLSIVQGEDSGLGGAMEYPSIKIIKNVKSAEALEYYIAHEVGHAWFYAAIGSNERDESYFDEGMTTFLEQKYTAQFHNGTNFQNRNLPALMMGSQKPILRHFTEGQICRHMHQALTTPVTDQSAINYGLNSYQIGSTLIQHIESLIGFNKLRDIIRSFYSKWKYKHPSYLDLLSHIEKESGLNLNGYQDIIAGKPVDMTIEKIKNNTIYFGNNGTPQFSVPLIIAYEDGSIERQNIVPSNGLHIIVGDMPIKSAILDPDQTSLDINPENNRYPRPRIGIRLIPGFDNPNQKDIYLSPLIGYNSYDGLMLGISMYNSTFPAKDLKWNITPFYGISSNNIIGQSWISYDTRPKYEKIRKIQYRIGLKSFSFANNSESQYDLRYLRVNPSVSIHHYHSPASKKYSKTTLSQLWVAREFPVLNDFNRFTQNITRLTHNRTNRDVLQPNELELGLEYNKYFAGSFFESQSYIKLSLDYRQGFLFKNNRRFDIRFFAAGFLKNSQRESSSFNSILATGSISLLSQGFTDYSYDEYFLDRQGNAKNAYRQIGYHGGGFKDALGSANGRIGQSNDFAMVINLKSHLPFGPPKLPLKLFFDAGYTRTKSFSSDPIEGVVLYSGGIMLELGDGILGIYLPLIGSENISNVYKSENRNLLSRITFSMDLHKLNPWKLIDEYNF